MSSAAQKTNDMVPSLVELSTAPKVDVHGTATYAWQENAKYVRVESEKRA